MDILERLKQQTADEHRAVENVVPLTRPGLTIGDYADYLEWSFPFYCAIEGRLKDVPGLERVLPDLDRRWKTPLIERDLFALGRPKRTETVRLEEIRNLAESLGVL